MKVRVNTSIYQSFGGINFMEADFGRLGLSSVINQYLGYRSANAVYGYADILKHLYYMFAIGGEVLDDLNTLREQLQDHPFVRVCSPDTVEYACSQLRQPVVEVVTDKGVKHHINEHAGFNRLLAELCLKGEVLNNRDDYTLDYDGHIAENTKPDSAYSYKQTQGYYPVVCSIRKLPVYIQNRNGNTPESYNQLSILTATAAHCRNLGLRLNKFRADACCYQKQTIEYLEQNGFTYYIRAELNEGLRIALEDETDWQPVMLNNRHVEVCCVEEKLFGDAIPRRVVAYRQKVKGQLTIDDINGYRYHAVVTNDSAAPLSCIEFYNQRGCEGEHHFKELDYDFGWNKLPFDNMAMNTVYLYASAIAYLLFNIFKHRYAEKLSFVRKDMRLKNFILHFVTLIAKWIKTARQHILKIFTFKDYRPLWAT